MNDAAIIKACKRLGINEVGCSTCGYLGSECDGGEPEYSISWPCCDKPGNERFQYLKSFPFKKIKSCYSPEFWGSAYSNLIKTGADGELWFALDLFLCARDRLLPTKRG